METQLFIIRHGHREDFDSEPPKARPCDPDISQIGVQQALETGQRIAKEGLSIIYSSPFLRTVHTASIIAKECNVKVRLDWGLAEWFCPRWWSEWPGTISSEVLARMFPEVEASEPTGFYPVLDEGQKWLYNRYENTAREIVARHEGQRIAIVTHGIAIMSLPLTLTGHDEVEGYGNHRLCGVTSMVLQNSKWRAEYLNDISHLTYVGT